MRRSSGHSFGLPQFPILTFVLVGLLLVVTNNALNRLLMNLYRWRPYQAGILVYALPVIGPALWLLVIALGLLLTTGSARPEWTRGQWQWAAAVLYVFHIPLILPFAPLSIFGRWGYSVSLFLAAVGTVWALRRLTGIFHIAALFLLVEPVMRALSRGYLHHAVRLLVMTLFSMAYWALIGWWFRDAAASHSPRTTTLPGSPKMPAMSDRVSENA